MKRRGRARFDSTFSAIYAKLYIWMEKVIRIGLARDCEGLLSNAAQANAELDVQQ